MSSNPNTEMVYVQLEHRAMEMLLSGDEPALQNLRVQRERAKIVGREFTDRGFTTTFSVPPEVLLDSDQNRTFQLRDVEASVSGVRIEFVLSVKNGAISTLAAYTANLEALPDSPEVSDVRFSGAPATRGNSRNVQSLRRTLYEFSDRHPVVFGTFLTCLTLAFALKAVEQFDSSVLDAAANGLGAVFGGFALFLFLKSAAVRRHSRR